jgi:hypothetical protein
MKTFEGSEMTLLTEQPILPDGLLTSNTSDLLYSTLVERR